MTGVRQIAVVSGKGGTGKTTLVASLLSLASAGGRKLVLVDADVDTPNLHILFGGKTTHRESVRGMPLAVINTVNPERGRRWDDVCAFGAITGIEVDPLRCVGCRVCEICAPPGGIRMEERFAGEIIYDELPGGPFLRARLFPGEPGFGGLVYRLRSMAEEKAMEEGYDLVIVDAAAGLGCPVIASLAGCDLAVIVAEPSLSGYHDFTRIYGLCARLGVRTTACINKHDVNPPLTRRIADFCRTNSIPLAGKIPFDECVMDALDEGKILVADLPMAEASRAVRMIAKELGLLAEGEGR